MMLPAKSTISHAQQVKSSRIRFVPLSPWNSDGIRSEGKGFLRCELPDDQVTHLFKTFNVFLSFEVLRIRVIFPFTGLP